MKKVIALLLLLTGVSHADTARVKLSSFTATNETAGYIAANRLILVDIGGTSANGCLKIYNSTWTTSAPLVSSVTLGTIGSHYYGDDGILLKGIYYTTTGNVNGVTLIYSK